MRWIAELTLFVVVIAALTVVGCTSASVGGGDVRLVGSDTMLPLNRLLAAGFMTGHPGVAVRVEGGGTGSGVDALLEGRTDLCAASRPFRPDEIQALYDEFETMGLRFLVARDALSVVVHPDNPVVSLSLDQLAGIFGGAVTDWSEVGGEPGTIEVVLRSPASGTHHFFRDHVLNGRTYTPAATTVARAGQVHEIVSSRPDAVGYGGLVHSEAVRAMPIENVPPSVASVRRGEYPLARYLFFYAAAPPTGDVKRFVDWCVSLEGQQVVAASGLISLWSED